MGRQRAQIWPGTALPLFSREESQDSILLICSGQCSQALSKEGPGLGGWGWGTVYLAFDQGHWGSLQKHFIGGQLLSHTLGKKVVSLKKV